MTRRHHAVLAAALGLALAGPAWAQIKIAGPYELSGAGASAGTMSENGVELAVKEIHAAGGILGQTIEATAADTQSDPGVAKGLASKAVAASRKGPSTGVAKRPGILIDVAFDDKGDLDRESFIVEVKDGKQLVREVVPPLSAPKKP